MAGIHNKKKLGAGTVPPEVKLTILHSDLLAHVESLYDQGLMLQAHQAGIALAPLECWDGVDGAILAGRIANNLGAYRISQRQHVRAYRLAPEQLRTRAYHLELVLQKRGPIFSWQRFRSYEKELATTPDSGHGEGWEYLFTLGARICAMLRDFARAEDYFKLAERHPSKTPWLMVERSAALQMQERWPEALALAQRALELKPWYRPAIQHASQCLHSLNQDSEALQLLREASTRLESLPVLAQLASLEMDVEHYEAALQTLDRAEKLSPILEAATIKWLAAQRCRAAGITGDLALAEKSAKQVKDEYHDALGERLSQSSRKWRRVQILVPFTQQHRMTCVPATLTMLRHFWHLPADHVELAEAICYDGTPTHRARRWAESNGMFAKEFTLNWDLAVALLDRQIPFAVFTAEATSAHVQVVVGYDELRRTFIIRDPSFPQIREAAEESFLKRYAANGPACMLLLPAAQSQQSAGLTFPDAEFYDDLREVQSALERHQRSAAETVFRRMCERAPDHWLTLTADRAIQSYDTNLPALLKCLEQLLNQFPEDGNLLLAKLSCLRELGRREDRMDFLKNICLRPEVDAVFHQQLAEELMLDFRQNRAAALAIRRSLRLQPFNSFSLSTLANQLWNQRQFEDALDAYRFAAFLDDKKDQFAGTYFSAALSQRETEEALAFLENRIQSNLQHSATPFITWFHARQQTGDQVGAVARLETVLAQHPEHGELWLFAADFHGRHGDLTKADRCLAEAEPKVQRTAFLKVKADLARYRTDGKSAVAIWREVLEVEPLSLPAHRALAWLLAECESREQAMKYLEGVCERFPCHYQLHQLWCDWARQAGPEVAEMVVRKLLATHPQDPWARRELALVLADAGRFDEALLEAEEGVRLAPQMAVSYATRAYIRNGLEQIKEAQEDYREAIRSSVDFAHAIHGLVNSGSTLEERRQSLAFIEQELVRQVVFGDGLSAYREAARLNLEPKTLLESLRVALKTRPDLAVAWSVVIRQLAEMLELAEAGTLAQEATQRFPLSEQAWLDLALVRRLILDIPGERAALQQAMQVAPVSNTAVKMLAEQYDRLGETARACELYEQACIRQPLDAYGHGSIAEILWRQGNQPAAMERIRHAIRLQPDYVWGWQQLAQWSTAIGKASMAEELAKIMVLQRPGEIRSLLILARMQIGSNRLPEALQAVNQAIQKFPRSVEAHELRAEILANQGHAEEAIAACEPDVWGKRPPVQLRIFRARLEAHRGNRVNAIERIHEVLRENPGLIGGWQNLADWHWQQEQFDEALTAATNIRRLDPLNPIPLGYRASLKMKRGERADAKADLETAIRLDPSYSFASLNLFEMQLEDSEIDAAWRTLDLIKRYAGAEKSKSLEVKLRTRYLQISNQSTGRKQKPRSEKDISELELAVSHLRELCSNSKAQDEHVYQAVNALLQTGEKKRVDKLLEEQMLQADAHPAVGTLWMDRRIERNLWFVPEKINRLCGTSPAARNAVIGLIKGLGNQNRQIERTILAAYIFIVLGEIASRAWRGVALLWLTWRHRVWLRANNDAWAAMGYALLKLQRHRLAIRWMRDWRERTGLQMWMLFNLVLALRTCARWPESLKVLEHAVTITPRDDSFSELRLFLALELALQGNLEKAQAHFHELPQKHWDNFMLVQLRFTKGLIRVMAAAPAEKSKVFKDERKKIRNLMSRNKMSYFRADYRRCMFKMAREAKQPWYVFLTWIGA